MPKYLTGLAAVLWASATAPVPADPPAVVPRKAVVWNVDNLEAIGGHRVTVVGRPRVTETDRGKAVAFDGRGDGLVIDANPLAGLKQFTAEVIFRPDAGGPREQRFLHFQPNGGEDRLLFETRLPGGGQWFLDTYLQAGAAKQTLYAEKSPHPLGAWYNATFVADGITVRHFVNGREELAAELPLTPLAAGRTSIGMRFNRVFWFRGAVRRIRVTPAVLGPEAFLRP